jgi:hypothetical protein
MVVSGITESAPHGHQAANELGQGQLNWHMRTRRAAGMGKPVRWEPAARESARLETSRDFPTLGSPPRKSMPSAGSRPGSTRQGGVGGCCSANWAKDNTVGFSAELVVLLMTSSSLLLLPPRGGFLFTFSHAVTFSLNHRHIGVMQQTIEKRSNASSIGKDLVPLFEGTVGCQNDGFAFVAAIDNFVE